MGEHYPAGQTECEAFCRKCGRMTLHRVDHPVGGAKGGGRKGPCIDPAHPVQEFSKKQQKSRAEEARKRQNPELFK
jgi:hypothetical protein